MARNRTPKTQPTNTNPLQQSTVVLSLTFHSISNTRNGNLSGVEIDADKDSVKLNKEFIRSPHFEQLDKIATKTKDFVARYALPRTPFRHGTYLVPVGCLEFIDPQLEIAKAEYEESADKLCADWENVVEDAKKRLRGQFDPKQYPKPELMRGKFGMSWGLLQFNTPDCATLGEALYAKERDKARGQWESTANEISQALRIAFHELVKRLSSQLEVGPDGKKKKVTFAAVRDINEFLDTFSQRNVLNDTDLDQLVVTARAVLDGKDVEAVKDSRETIGAELQKVSTTLTGLVETSKRTFKFDD